MQVGFNDQATIIKLMQGDDHEKRLKTDAQTGIDDPLLDEDELKRQKHR